MKKIFFIIILALSILSISACGSSYVDNSSISANVINKTVSIDGIKPSEIKGKKIQKTNFENEREYIPKTLEEMCANATCAVYGEVKAITYFGDEGFANTAYDFLIEKVYKGGLNPNEMITVGIMGGYILLSEQSEEAESVYEYQSNEGSPDPKVGDKYLVFLDLIEDTQEDTQKEIYQGMYREHCTYYTRYIRGSDGMFERYLGNFKDEKQTLPQLEAKLETFNN